MTAENGWYYARGQETVGPLALEDLVKGLSTASGMNTLVFGPGTPEWTEARHVASVVNATHGRGAPPPPPFGGRQADEIDYEIFGHEMQYVEITLDPNEMVIAEPGMLMYMTAGIKMETVLGDPSQQSGFLGKIAAAGKRLLTGEKLFVTTFSNVAGGREQAAFASPFPGKIIPMHLDQLGGELICQKDSFVCAARGVKIGIAFQKKFGVGMFGGEGFIMQRLTGDGIALIHAGGTMMKRTLQVGETLRLDTGCLVALSPSVTYDIQLIGGIKNTLFGGEGLFFATLTGPGEVWCQSLPFSRLAGRIAAAAGKPGGKEEGSILGRLGSLLNGDNT